MKVLVKNVRGLADMCMQVRCSAPYPAYTCPRHLQFARITPVSHGMSCSPQYTIRQSLAHRLMPDWVR